MSVHCSKSRRRVDRGMNSNLMRAFDGWDGRLHSSGEFSLLFRGHLTFSHSLDTEMSLEKEKNKIFKDGGV